MNFNPTEIVQSAQVWVCESCGTQDHKTCSCNSPARMEKLADKREADRQRQKRHREKVNENNDRVTCDADVENIEEFSSPLINTENPSHPVADVDDDTPESERTAFILRADTAERMATYSGRATRRVYEAARFTADAWTRLADDLKKRVKQP
jgi:hypothetical protein